VEEVRVVDFLAGCDSINDQVHFSILGSCGPRMGLDVGFACNICLAALQKTEYCSKSSAEKYFSVGSVFPVYRGRRSLRLLQRVF